MNFRTPVDGFNTRWDAAKDGINELEDHFLKSFEIKALSGEGINKFIKETCLVKIFNMGVQKVIIGQKQNVKRNGHVLSKTSKNNMQLIDSRNYVKPKQDNCWGKPYIGTLFWDCWTLDKDKILKVIREKTLYL